MKKIEELLKPLHLIYYEYNKQSNLLVLDASGSKDNIYKELIRITYTLTTKGIKFFIDKNKSIVIYKNNSLLSKIKRYYKSLFNNIKNKQMNIYILNDKKVKWAKNLPVFTIELIKQKIDLSPYDALIFTSKNAIESINSMDKSWKTKPAYVIGPQTAKIVNSLDGNLKFIGNEKYGDDFVLEIIKKFQNQKILYIRGTKIASDLVNILNANDIVCEELIVYETVCINFKQEVKLPKNSTIIFSSPSTIKYFLNNISWDESFKAISIGRTTAKYFPPYIIPTIADTTSLESCVQKAIELDSKN